MATLAPPLKNAAYVLDLDVFDNSGKFLTGATFSSYQISKDGGSFATLTNAPTEISATGVYVISLTATEMNADRVHLRFVVSGMQDIGVSLVTVARQFNDLAFPLTSGRGENVDTSGRVLLQPTQPSVIIPTVTTLTNAPSDSAGVTTLLTRLSSARALYLDLLNTYLDASVAAVNTLVGLVKAKTDNLPSDPADESLLETAITNAQTAILADTTTIKNKTNNLPSSPAAVGSQMDLISSPNVAAVNVLQANLATSAQQTSISNKLGAITGSGLNTVLGYFRALARSDASILPTDLGGVFDNTTDSLQAIRAQGDIAWSAGGGGDPAGVTTLLTRIPGVVQPQTGDAYAQATSAKSDTTAIKNQTDKLQFDLSNHVLSVASDSAGVTTLLNRLTDARAGYLDILSGWSGTLLTAIRALARNDAPASVDIGGSYDATNDSLEALQAQIATGGTGGGGGGGGGGGLFDPLQDSLSALSAKLDNVSSPVQETFEVNELDT